MNPHFPAFKRIITYPVLFKFFVFQKLSSAFWAGLSIAHFDEKSCEVRVKLSWFNQNPFRSMYFAVEAMAAEMSCGMLALGQIYKRQPAVSMLVEKLEAKFVKKATGVIIFTCEDGEALRDTVNEALQNPEGRKLQVTSIGRNQAGEIVAELEKLGLRENTLVIFSGDNGTALTFPAPIGGRMINGKKASMLEGGSRVPFVASWPGTTPAGKVSKDIVNFTDMHATFLDLANVKPPTGFKFDSRSIAPQLRGEKGTPREWAFVQLGNTWYVREQGWKLNESGELFDMSDAPFVEKPVAADDDSEMSKAARKRLAAVLAELNPAAGKTDADGDPRTKNRDGNKKVKKNQRQ
jgi:hypothetical protein